MPEGMSIGKGVFFFDPEDKIYKDHFPGAPVVPGSVIIHAFLSLIEDHGYPMETIMVENFRFRKFITPGEYPYEIEKNGDDYRCLLFRKGEVAAVGRINDNGA